jgi:hypothetical protein
MERFLVGSEFFPCTADGDDEPLRTLALASESPQLVFPPTRLSVLVHYHTGFMS